MSITIDSGDIVAWKNELDNAFKLFTVRFRHVIRDRPAAPPMFYGRGGLVAELTDLIVNGKQHIVLIGTGGTGKSSLAKAIFNEPLVIKEFAERRFFITYDDLNPSTITFDMFAARFAERLGKGCAGADPMLQISTFLRSAPALIVLDDADTFMEVSESKAPNEFTALEETPPAIANIGNIPGVVLILIYRSETAVSNISTAPDESTTPNESMTPNESIMPEKIPPDIADTGNIPGVVQLMSRSGSNDLPNVRWTTRNVTPLDIESALDAFFQIYSQARRGDFKEEITTLLKGLEFHPLCINLLASVAQENKWSPPILLKKWKNQPEQSEGKPKSLPVTMQLSLSSPSIQKLGKDGLRTLAVIAFLPQGLNVDLAEHLLPSLRDIIHICEVLCKQSLVYRQGIFIKMLAPIRHYFQNPSFEALISPCLGDIRNFFYSTIQQCSRERDSHADIIVSDHLNIEHVIAFGFSHFPTDAGKTFDICGQFLWCLRLHLPRPTTLDPAIFKLANKSSTYHARKVAECLMHLGVLYLSLSLPRAIYALKTAEDLYLNSGDDESVAECVAIRANWYKWKGHFLKAQKVLDDLQDSASWRHLSEARKAWVWFTQDDIRRSIFTTSADELFSRSMEDRVWGLWSKARHWRAKLYYGEDSDITLVKLHLEKLLPQSTEAGELHVSHDVLRGLAEVAFLQGKLCKAMDILQKMEEMGEGKDPENVTWSISRKAVVASLLGDHEFARELMQKTYELFEFFALPSTDAFLQRYYGAAQVELTAGNYGKAESHFNAVIKGCNLQEDLFYKALSFRGLGEVACSRDNNTTLAKQHFAETRSLCIEMGVQPQKLYSCDPLYTLPERFKEWVSFLEGRSPFPAST